MFRRGEYRIDLDYEVHNGGTAPWEARPYLQILRNDPPTKRSYFNVSSYAFHGPAIYDGTRYRKLDASDTQDSHLSLDVRDGWVAALQHHFVSAIVPPRNVPWHLGLGAMGQAPATWPNSATKGPAAGRSRRNGGPLSPPAVHRTLGCRGSWRPPRWLGRVADYGRLWVLAQPLFRALSFVHHLTGNWGVSIILVTFLLKLLFYPLSEASGRSMAKMKTLAPRIKNLQDTYKDDKEKLGRAMMELYKREKDQSVTGCLPILIK